MAIAIDASSPAGVTASGLTATTASFTPPADSLILAVCAIGNSTGAGSVTGAITDSISSAGWSKIASNSVAAEGAVELWAMDAGSTPSARTVTLTGSGANGKGLIIDVLVLTGAKPKTTALGNVASASAITANITVTLDGSYVLFAVADNNGSSTYTALTDNTVLTQFNDTTNGEKYGTGRSTSWRSAGVFAAGFSGTSSQPVIGAWEIEAAPTSFDGAITMRNPGAAFNVVLSTASVTPITGAYWGIKNIVV